MSVDLLKEDIKQRKIKSVYLFYGPEEYLKKYYLDSIEQIILQEELKSLNKVVLEGKVEVRNIIDHCETLPVFSERKLVVVRNSGLLKGKGKSGQESKGKGAKDELTDYLSTIPDSTCLVFYEEEIDKRMKVVDAVKKNGLLVEFSYQKPVELVKWVIKVVKSHKKDISSLTASQLVENCEQGMTEILNEITKLILYTENRPAVTGEDIEKVCTKSVKSRIFDLTDAISEKNTAKALKFLEDMVIVKEPMPRVLFMVTRQFRQILEMKVLCSTGMRMEDAAGKMGITTFAAGKIYRQSSGFTVETLKQAVQECLDFDLDIKTGRMNDRIAVELLITQYSKK